MGFDIPQDMIVEQSESGGTVVSIRDLLVLAGMSDEELAEHDRIDALRDDILSREPWRDQRKWVCLRTFPNGMSIGNYEGGFDWSGTEMEEIDRKASEEIFRSIKEKTERAGDITDG